MRKPIYLQLLFLFTALQTANCQPQSSIIFMGDSFTAGDGVQKEKRFTALVDQNFSKIKCINQGRSGWATSSYLRRWDEVINKMPDSADMIFIQLGGNDLRIDGHSKETIKKCGENMGEITDRIKTKYPNAVIVLMSSVKVEPERLAPKIKEAGFGKHSNTFTKKIGKTFKKLAKQRNYGYIDLISKLPTNSSHDGVHLNEVGHRVIANALIEYLR